MKTFAKVLANGCLVMAIALVGCKKEETPPPEAPPLPPLAKTQSAQPSGKAPPLAPGQSNELPPGHPPIGGGMGGTGGAREGMPKPEAGDVEIDKAAEGSAGLKLTAPEGWQAMAPPAPSNSGFQVAGPLAVFKLEKVDGDKEDAVVRLTHFPGMKNIPVEMQLDRWFDQVRQPDGSSTKDKAKVDTWEKDGVKISVADMSGTMMPESGTVRMIAAIIEHPNGPHFVKATGPVDTIEHWRESIMTYLRSSTIEE
jgi:hypothetical protein